MDLGTYGSERYRNNREAVQLLEQQMEGFMSKLFGRRTSLAEWEKNFFSVCQSKVFGYIAMVQKTIAAKGKVLMLAGTGTFLQSAKGLYRKFHKSDQVYFDKMCT